MDKILVCATACWMMACSTASPPVKTADAEEKSVHSAESAAPGAERVARPSAHHMTRVGDFMVHRFTGSFSDAPMTLTETVVAREGIMVVVEVTLEGAGEQKSMRVVKRVHGEQDVLSVASLDGDVTIKSFGDMMAKTEFIVDRNDGFVKSEKKTCLVDRAEYDCEEVSYRVSAAWQEATLKIATRPQLMGRDLGGEILSSDGSWSYRAELGEIGQEKTPASSGAAR